MRRGRGWVLTACSGGALSGTRVVCNHVLTPHVVGGTALCRLCGKCSDILADTAPPEPLARRRSAHERPEPLPLERCLHLRLARVGLGLEDTARAVARRLKGPEPEHPLVHERLRLAPQLVQERVELVVVRPVDDVAQLVEHRAQDVVEVEEAVVAAHPPQPDGDGVALEEEREADEAEREAHADEIEECEARGGTEVEVGWKRVRCETGGTWARRAPCSGSTPAGSGSAG